MQPRKPYSESPNLLNTLGRWLRVPVGALAAAALGFVVALFSSAMIARFTGGDLDATFGFPFWLASFISGAVFGYVTELLAPVGPARRCRRERDDFCGQKVEAPFASKIFTA